MSTNPEEAEGAAPQPQPQGQTQGQPVASSQPATGAQPPAAPVQPQFAHRAQPAQPTQPTPPLQQQVQHTQPVPPAQPSTPYAPQGGYQPGTNASMPYTAAMPAVPAAGQQAQQPRPYSPQPQPAAYSNYSYTQPGQPAQPGQPGQPGRPGRPGQPYGVYPNQMRPQGQGGDVSRSLKLYFNSVLAIFKQTPFQSVLQATTDKMMWLWSTVIVVVLSALYNADHQVLGYSTVDGLLSSFLPVPLGDHSLTSTYGFKAWILGLLLGIVFYLVIVVVRSVLNMLAVKMRGGQYSFQDSLAVTAIAYSPLAAIGFVLSLLQLLASSSFKALAFFTALLILIGIALLTATEIIMYSCAQSRVPTGRSILLPFIGFVLVGVLVYALMTYLML